MKHLALLFPTLLAGCVSLEFPNVVSDTARATRDAYRSVVGTREAAPASPATGKAEQVVHSYVGQPSQSVADVQKGCQEEAVEKLRKVAGKDAQYVVAENTVVIINSVLVANCRLTLAPQAQGTGSPEKK